MVVNLRWRSGSQHCGRELVEEAEEAEAEEEEEEMVLTRRVYGWYVCFLM